MMNTKTLLVVALLLGAGIYAVTANSIVDPLKDVQSGVAADLIVHAAIIDGATGVSSASSSVNFEPTRATASFAPAAIGVTFAPLAYGSAGVGGSGTNNGCASNLKPMTNYFEGDGNGGITPPRAYTYGQVYEGNPVSIQPLPPGVNSPTVNLYKDGAYAGAFDQSRGSLVSRGHQATQMGFYDFGIVDIAPNTALWTIAFKDGYCPARSNIAVANADGSSAGATCVAVTDNGFRVWLQSRGYNPDCIYQNDIENLNKQYQDYLKAPCSTGCGSNGGGGSIIETDPTHVQIPITIGGEVATKNIIQPVKLDATATIKTAAGKTFTKSFSSSVPAQGGPITGFAMTMDLTKAEVGTGRTSITVTVSASGQDAEGASRGDRGSVDLFVDQDYSGEIKMTVRAASFVTTVGMPDGTTQERTRTLAPKTLSFAS